VKVRIHLSRGGRVFRSPMPGARVAVLVPWFEEDRISRLLRRERKIRVFGHGWCREAEAFRPEMIAATRRQVESLLRSKTIGASAGIPSFGLVVLSRPGERLLNASERDCLWQTLRVPVYEQMIGTDSTLLAAECEAHDGLHLSHADLQVTGYTLVRTPCGCGRKTPRIIASAPSQAKAASAFSTV
jgi:hypothetical protein